MTPYFKLGSTPFTRDQATWGTGLPILKLTLSLNILESQFSFYKVEPLPGSMCNHLSLVTKVGGTR